MLARIISCPVEAQQRWDQIVRKAFVSIACMIVNLDDTGRRTMTNREAYAGQAQMYVENKTDAPKISSSKMQLGRKLAYVSWHSTVDSH